MKTILNNPYRIVGLLVGATAKEQAKQISRLKKYIDAEQDPQDDFSFPALGEFHRTLESVEEAASKLNLDRDKINAALFWFWNGNPITDEPAFEALKIGKTEDAIEIWRKQVYNAKGEMNEVSKRNASAFFNLSTFYLNEYPIDEEALILKLYFLESNFIKEFTYTVVDETVKTENRELQLIFLKNIEINLEIEQSEFIDVITQIDFVGKQDFLKSFIQKQFEKIEHKIDIAKNKRKASKANAAITGLELFSETEDDLTQLRSIIGSSDLKYTSIADKVANEVLQCSIDYFNDSQEKNVETDYAETAMKLAKQAESVAVGNLTTGRIKDSISTLIELKYKEISAAINALKSVKDAYENACKQIDEQVEELQFITLPDFEGNGEPIKIPKSNVSINWSKVEEMKQKSIKWDKVVELIRQVIPPQNIEKIKNINNASKLNEYKSLVTFVISKLSYMQKNKVRYICYWESQGGITMLSSNDTGKFPDWIVWVGGVIILIIMLILAYS
jgi:hypothetical protein